MTTNGSVTRSKNEFILIGVYHRLQSREHYFPFDIFVCGAALSTYFQKSGYPLQLLSMGESNSASDWT